MRAAAPAAGSLGEGRGPEARAEAAAPPAAGAIAHDRTVAL